MRCFILIRAHFNSVPSFHNIVTMANEEQIITDPLGNQVRINSFLCETGLHPTQYETFDDAFDVIRKPIMLIELTDSPVNQLCYYRSIGWGTTLLILVKKMDDEWEAFRCIKNPSPATVSDLLKRGRQLI